jgi:hypothetical protein
VAHAGKSHGGFASGMASPDHDGGKLAAVRKKIDAHTLPRKKVLPDTIQKKPITPHDRAFVKERLPRLTVFVLPETLSGGILKNGTES